MKKKHSNNNNNNNKIKTHAGEKRTENKRSHQKDIPQILPIKSSLSCPAASSDQFKTR